MCVCVCVIFMYNVSYVGQDATGQVILQYVLINRCMHLNMLVPDMCIIVYSCRVNLKGGQNTPRRPMIACICI
jgi:hypothetical protein